LKYFVTQVLLLILLLRSILYFECFRIILKMYSGLRPAFCRPNLSLLLWRAGHYNNGIR